MRILVIGNGESVKSKMIQAIRRDINEPDKLVCHLDRLEQALRSEERQPQWIPVGERLPELDWPVLVYCGSLAFAWVSSTNGKWMSREYYPEMPLVTHWMPLPKLPVEA